MATWRAGSFETSLNSIAVFMLTLTVGWTAEFTHGDQVVFTGGPSAPPESRDTGLKVEIGLRGGTPVGPSEGPGPERPDERKRPLRIDDLSGRPQLDLRDLARNSQPDLRGSALNSLALVGSKDLETDSRQTLRQSLDDEDPRVVSLGARLLADIGDVASVPPLVRLLDCGEAPVELSAVRALGRLGDEGVLPDLERLSGLEIPELSPEARMAIGRIRNRRAAGDAGDASVRVRDASAAPKGGSR